MKRYHLAIDIGASSGRCTVGYLEEGRLQLEEIHRFSNGIVKKGRYFTWNLDLLKEEIMIGLKLCKVKNRIPETIGIDTWGVDYVLLDQNDEIIGEAIAYRDERTASMNVEVEKIISQEELYQRTGIQKQPFNTIYQLMDEKLNTGRLERAETMLMIPDYLNFFLTGKKVQEYTNASTTQLLLHEEENWDYDLIEKLGYPRKIFQKIVKPSHRLGSLREDLVGELSYDCDVIVPATHDTASAVLCVPSVDEQPIYISSGTWSLVGTILPEKLSNRESMICNLTNEGAHDGRIRYLKNIMGLWMIQGLLKEYDKDSDFQELMNLAEKAVGEGKIDCNASRFLNPESMFSAIREEAERQKIRVPETIAEAAKLTYSSLAEAYKETIVELEKISGVQSDRIYVVGGGAKATYLNRLTAEATVKVVVAGPVEATSIGNLIIQLQATKQLDQESKSIEGILKELIIGCFEPKIVRSK